MNPWDENPDVARWRQIPRGPRLCEACDRPAEFACRTLDEQEEYLCSPCREGLE